MTCRLHKKKMSTAKTALTHKTRFDKLSVTNPKMSGRSSARKRTRNPTYEEEDVETTGVSTYLNRPFDKLRVKSIERKLGAT